MVRQSKIKTFHIKFDKTAFGSSRDLNHDTQFVKKTNFLLEGTISSEIFQEEKLFNMQIYLEDGNNFGVLNIQYLALIEYVKTGLLIFSNNFLQCKTPLPNQMTSTIELS